MESKSLKTFSPSAGGIHPPSPLLLSIIASIPKPCLSTDLLQYFEAVYIAVSASDDIISTKASNANRSMGKIRLRVLLSMISLDC